MIFNAEEITSRQNPYVSYVCKLSEKKHRDNENKFRFDGIKLFHEAMSCGVEIEAVLVTREGLEKLTPILNEISQILPDRNPHCLPESRQSQKR